jgi:predicted Fe-Mo cluster-binding NifX family protein
MAIKALLALQDNFIAPRFDLATEIIIADIARNHLSGPPRTIILPRKNAEALCDLIVKEGVGCVVCGGIEENFYNFFVWKKIRVIDNVIGSAMDALERILNDTLEAGSILPTARRRAAE